MTKNSIIKIAVFTTVFLAGSLLLAKFVLATGATATYCPSNTTVTDTQANLVGEVTDDGGDPNLTVWFDYGKTVSYGIQTNHMSKYGVGLFCTQVFNLEPCTTYHYRAVAQNSAGTDYGQDYTFTTKCAPVTVDLKANGSNGPITLNVQDYVNLSWTSQNAVSCQASGDWSSSKNTNGYESVLLNVFKTYNFTITCMNADGTQTAQDSVQVIVKVRPPMVITKPAVVTY